MERLVLKNFMNNQKIYAVILAMGLCFSLVESVSAMKSNTVKFPQQTVNNSSDIEDLKVKDHQENKFVWSKESMPTIISNGTIQCKDCKHMYEEIVIECDKYFVKPNYVLDKAKNCPDYEKKID